MLSLQNLLHFENRFVWLVILLDLLILLPRTVSSLFISPVPNYLVQVNLVETGKIFEFKNAKVDVFDGYMRLIVDRY